MGGGRQLGVSVVVCCYNSSQRLPKTLNHILNQQTRSEMEWEVIVVNNNSTDDTVLVANDILASARQQLPFKVVDEPEPGLSHARKKGYDTAKYEFLLLVDDDNWLTPSYVQNVFDLFTNNPAIGIIGGLGEPEFEEEPPTWFPEFSSCYALGPQANVKQGESWVECQQVYGAGLAMRMEAYDMLKDAGYTSILSDRKGGALISGGDTELCMAINLSPYKVIYDERLKFKHLMPAGRINWAYLKKLTLGFGRSTVKTQIYNHYILGRKLPPTDRRFPLWLDRLLNLLKTYPKYLKYIIRGKMIDTPGDAGMLEYLGWKGRLIELYDLKGQYLEDHQQVNRLAANLAEKKLPA